MKWKISCQLAYLSSSCFPYYEPRHLVNTIVIKRLLTGTSHDLFWYDPITANWDTSADWCITSFSRYEITTTDWDSIKNSIDAPDVIFSCLTTANLHYDLFGELDEGFLPLPVSNTPKNPIIGTHYGQYDELLTDLHSTSDCNCDKKMLLMRMRIITGEQLMIEQRMTE